jgi:hypothetical protein
LSISQLQDLYVGPNGLIYNSVQLAIRFLKLPMFRVILTSVKQVMGQRPLTFLLKRFIWGNSEWFETLVEIIIDGIEGITGYQQVNEMIFENHITLESIRIVNEKTFNKMVSVVGIEKWTKRLLDMNVGKGFHLLSRYHLSHFDRSQMSGFVKSITSNTNGLDNNYWDRLLFLDLSAAQDFPCSDFENDFGHILKCVWDKLGQEKMKLYLCDVNGVQAFLPSIVQSLFMYGEKSLAYRMFDFVKESQDGEFIQRLMECMPCLLHFVMDPFRHVLLRNTIIQARVKVLEFALDHAGHLSNARQLSGLVDALLLPHEDYDGRTRSIWCYAFNFDFFYAEEVVSNRVGQFLECVSRKLNKRIVKELATHRYETDTGRTSVMFYSALKDRMSLVEVMLAQLDEADREEVRRIQVNVPQEYNRRNGYQKLF